MTQSIRFIIIAVISVIASSFTVRAQTTLSYEDMKGAIELLNKSCPSDMGNNITLTAVTLTTSQFTISMLVNEDDEVIEIMTELADSLKPTFLAQFNADEDLKLILNSCKQLKINFAIKMYNVNNTMAVIKIPYTEM